MLTPWSIFQKLIVVQVVKKFSSLVRNPMVHWRIRMFRTQLCTNVTSLTARVGFDFVMCLIVSLSVERSVTQMSLLCEGIAFCSAAFRVLSVSYCAALVI